MRSILGTRVDAGRAALRWDNPGVTTHDAVDRIARRYGRGRPRWRWLLISLLVIALVLAGWFGWALWVNLNPKVTSGSPKWIAHGQNSVEVWYDVRLHADGVTATCTVQAEDPDGNVLGQKVFKISESRQGSITFPTERETARIDWQGCTAPGQRDAR